jgi:hypothetical protein
MNTTSNTAGGASESLMHFVGTKEPMWELNSEQAWHKAAAFAFALGASARDVARQLGRSEPAVQNLTRQKWFQEQVTGIMAEYGAKDVMKVLQGEQFNSLSVLVEMRDNPRVPAASRIACARDILDRGLGKPTQRIEMSHDVVSDNPVAEVERLEQENNRLRNEQRSCEFGVSGGSAQARSERGAN